MVGDGETSGLGRMAPETLRGVQLLSDDAPLSQEGFAAQVRQVAVKPVEGKEAAYETQVQ